MEQSAVYHGIYTGMFELEKFQNDQEFQDARDPSQFPQWHDDNYSVLTLEIYLYIREALDYIVEWQQVAGTMEIREMQQEIQDDVYDSGNSLLKEFDKVAEFVKTPEAVQRYMRAEQQLAQRQAAANAVAKA